VPQLLCGYSSNANGRVWLSSSFVAAIRLEAALRGWRLVEARRRGVPAFRIFSDRTLRALATSRPVTTQELLAVPGLGTSTVAKYGTKICRVLRENGG
jgi:DNA topoisomerase-3